MATSHSQTKSGGDSASDAIDIEISDGRKVIATDEDLFYEILRQTGKNYYILQQNYDDLLSRLRCKYIALQEEHRNTKRELESTQELLSHFMDLQGRREKRDLAMGKIRRHYGRIECDCADECHHNTPNEGEDMIDSMIDNFMIPKW